MVHRQPREGLSDIAHRRLCDNAATRTLVWFNASSLFLGLSLSHRHLGDEAATAREGGRQGERERHKNWARMVIRRMDTPRPPRAGTQLHLCVWWECADVAGELFIQRSPGQTRQGGRQAAGWWWGRKGSAFTWDRCTLHA